MEGNYVSWDGRTDKEEEYWNFRLSSRISFNFLLTEVIRSSGKYRGFSGYVTTWAMAIHMESFIFSMLE